MASLMIYVSFAMFFVLHDISYDQRHGLLPRWWITFIAAALWPVVVPILIYYEVRK
jgi:hypothetical protein